jgi:hypothetical protein
VALESVRLPVLNSLIFLRDERTRNIPEIDGNGAAWSTPACVAVSCLPDCDGETEVTIGTVQEVTKDGALLFDGLLETPSRSMVVETVLRKTILQIGVRTSQTRVRIWTNGLQDTDEVIIGLG